MQNRISRAFLSLASVFLLSQCAAQGPYPSLAPRAAEREYAEEMGRVPPPPPAIAEDAMVTERIRALTAEARTGQTEFEAALATASAAAARAGAAGSDSWVEAQQAVSRAVSAQARTTRALADLDQFALARTAEGALGAADARRLREAVEDIQRLAAAQAERVERLEGSLRRG